MNQGPPPRGWQLHHHEQLFFRASTGAPLIRLKFFHYPSYRQTVTINQPPQGCRLKTKRDNTFFVFQHKVRTKGNISLERIITIYPHPFTAPADKKWGRISDNPWLLQRKYKQSFSYWPLHSSAAQDISQEHWFATDELSTWVREVSRYISLRIRYPEKQDKRFGADHALRTGSGDCDEFTDLFVTLARIRGIPCRRLTGFFIHQEPPTTEPHAWGEFLSPIIGWIPIDIALRNIGSHTTNYVIGKIEEFTPSLADYHLLNQSTSVHYHWERPNPTVLPVY